MARWRTSGWAARARRALAATTALSALGAPAAPLGAVAATDDAPTAEAIVAHVNGRDDGSRVSRTLVMKLIDKRGTARTRETRSFRKDFEGERRAVIVFTAPKSIKDTGFLTWDYREPGKSDDLWLYLPALRRVRRIASGDRGASFVGTDLSYEDMKNETRIVEEDYVFTVQGPGEVAGQRCWLLEGVPRDDAIARELGYGRVVSCIDAAMWLPRRSDYWDRAGRHLKTAELKDLREVDGIWTAHRIEVHNHRTGHSTILEFSDVDYSSPVDDDLFTERSLRTGIR